MPDSNFDQWKSEPVEKLAQYTPTELTPGDAERHTIYSLALMAITHHYWNGNKYGRGVLYPLNEPVNFSSSSLLAGDYNGHNIAALAVDADGSILDFDFNHNELFNSSVEHAESRLLRRLFSLTQINESWNTASIDSKRESYGMLLKNVTLYTTLESCAQCSGIMALAQLGRVVFLQTDPGQYSIGNMMRNLTVGTGLAAPEPLPAHYFGFPFHNELDAAYQTFRARPKDKEHAMVLNSNGELIPKQSDTTSITSFLCTKAARDIYEKAKAQLDAFTLLHADYVPKGASSTCRNNAEVFVEARHFVKYATIDAQRGTPHRA